MIDFNFIEDIFDLDTLQGRDKAASLDQAQNPIWEGISDEIWYIFKSLYT